MANKVIISLRKDINVEDIKDEDILVYDATKKEYYTVTPELFFDKYESKLNKLLERYDKSDKEKANEIAQLRKEFLEFKKDIQENNSKLINMVDTFIKGGKK